MLAIFKLTRAEPPIRFTLVSAAVAVNSGGQGQWVQANPRPRMALRADANGESL